MPATTNMAVESVQRSGVAFAFDIDGVLVNGKTAIPHAREALIYLQEKIIPFFFLTNSGGVTERDNLNKLETRLGQIKFSDEQMVQSHTPFHSLVHQFKKQTILVLGGVGERIRQVANAYGFHKVVTSSDLFVNDQTVHPFPEMTREEHLKSGHKIESNGDPIQIHAVLVWSSPRDWCLDLQLLLDVLLSTKGILGTRSQMNGNSNMPNNGYLQDGQPKVYFCNPDLEWSCGADFPRLAQGAFAEAFRGIWNAATSSAELESQIVRCGKPTWTTYQYGESALLNHIARSPVLAGRKVSQVYMIGDNPASDIAGANAFFSPRGIVWYSILVQTGVHQAGTVPAFKPTYIADDVAEAIEWALTPFEAQME